MNSKIDIHEISHNGYPWVKEERGIENVEIKYKKRKGSLWINDDSDNDDSDVWTWEIERQGLGVGMMDSVLYFRGENKI